MTVGLWPLYAQHLIATFQIVAGSVALSSCCALFLMGFLSKYWETKVLNKLMGLWMLMPTLFITSLLFDWINISMNIEGCIFVMACGQLPFFLGRSIMSKNTIIQSSSPWFWYHA